MRKRLFWRIFPPLVIITIVSLAALTWYASTALRQFHLDHVALDLEAQAHLLTPQMSDLLDDGNPARLDSLSKQLGSRAGTRLTIILPSGRVIGDSEEAPETMDDHRDRPEVRAALAGAIGRSVRFSHTLQKTHMYVALPVRSDGKVICVLRTSRPVTSIRETLRTLYDDLLLGSMVVALLAVVAGIWVSRRISRPLEEMKRGAERFARGDLDSRLPVYGTEEMAALAETMNQMAAELNDRIQKAVQQRNELEAVLSSMVEGVLAVDNEQRIISMNEAAARLLGTNRDRAQGQHLLEVIRNADLERFIEKALSSSEPVEGEVTLRSLGERFVQAYGSILTDSQGKEFGALVVLNDITKLRRLEGVRREFVANVSHELRTPVTSIEGFIETLLDGRSHTPEDTKRFLEIISRHADRLGTIIDDLLSLSRIEQEAEAGTVELEETQLESILLGALQICEVIASERQIEIQLICSDRINVRANGALLEEAVANLMDNAIKYSDPGSPVTIEASQSEDEVVIHVRDKGSGIEEEHLSRIFERFYRVDKARSRKLGGTGLGLSIVKHIAQAHGGSAAVESIPGQGSVFSIHLPRL